jgi:hypothetical protein
VELPQAIVAGPLERDLERAGSLAFSSLAALKSEDRWRRMMVNDEAMKRSAEDFAHLSVAGHRLDGCLRDVVAFAPAVRLLHDVGNLGRVELAKFSARYCAEGTTEATVSAFNDARRYGEAFLASLKAAHFLVRALQDAAYRVLKETLMETQPGTYNSMQSAASTPADPVRPLLDAAAPGYLEWFVVHKRLRDEFKRGVATGGVYTHRDGSPKIEMTGLGVSLNTLDEALTQSIRLVGVIVRTSEGERARRAEREAIIRDLREHLTAGALLSNEGELEAFCATLSPSVKPTELRGETIKRVASRLRQCGIDLVRDAAARATSWNSEGS